MDDELEEAAVTLHGELSKFSRELEEGKWYIPIKDKEIHEEPLKIERLTLVKRRQPARLKEKFAEAYKAEGITVEGKRRVYEAGTDSNYAKEFGDKGTSSFQLIPYHGMNIVEEVSKEEELLDAEEILGSDGEEKASEKEVKETLEIETDSGQTLTKEDTQPTDKEANKFRDFYISPVFRDRFR